MSQSHHDESRRRFLRAGLLGVAAAPLGAALVSRQAQAQDDMPQLTEDDPAAQALSYVHDAAEAGGARTEGANCANCQLFTDRDGAEWGPCSAFPGKLVNRNGWCSAWVEAS
ncbi:high-potential iron-sulfur protein [Arhodomonas sp. SL1]|uniref:high-potential iron-sulfur protein n=1 Tax=Arhodomonas sp. SL1 TaxID=3425691 RepID=UPI003F88298A